VIADHLHNLTTHVDGQTDIEFVDEDGRPLRVVDFTANGHVRIILAVPPTQPPPPPDPPKPGEKVFGLHHVGPLGG
jgi:hypothetical protein